MRSHEGRSVSAVDVAGALLTTPLLTHELGSLGKPNWRVRSKAGVTGPISLAVPYHNAEFEQLQGFARAELKVPITGAYTIADWSFDERYFAQTSLEGPASERHGRRKAARRQFILDVARNLI